MASAPDSSHHLSLNQRVSVVIHYYECGRSLRETSRRLAKEFGINKVNHKTIKRIVEKFNETGSVADAPKAGRPSTVNTEAKGLELTESLIKSPQKSTRRLGLELGMSHMSVWRLCKKLKLKAYIPRLFHALHDSDQDKRVEFAEDFLLRLRNNESLLDHIWWSDEAMFKLNGHINRHNCVYWAAENPRIIIEREVNLPGVVVWCAMSSKGIIGPFFFENTVTGESYLKLLRDEFWPLVQEDNYFFQQDGATPHYAIVVRDWLNQTMPERWIGRRGPVEWPSRSPDLTPMDFFLWGVLKDMVYSEKPNSVANIKQIIKEKVQLINSDKDLCQKVCHSVKDRLEKIIKYEGVQIEAYL